MLILPPPNGRFVKLGAHFGGAVLAEAPLPVPSREGMDVFGKQLKKKKSRFWKAVGVSFLTLFGLGAGWVAFTEKGRKTAQGVTEMAPKVIQAYQNPDLLFDQVGQDQVNILLVGEDYNWKIDKVFNPRTGKYAPFQVIDTDSPPRSDTMIVFTLNRENKTMRLLSMPRDARISFADLDGDVHRRRKLNSVYSSGGTDPAKRMELLRKVIGEEFGIRIDRSAVIKPNSFKKLVDMVGGVYVNVDGALKRDSRTGKLYRGHIHYRDNWGQWGVDLDPGPQWLDGEQAHGYVRFRYDREGDPGRIRRQQQVMKALAKSMMGKAAQPWQLSDLVTKAREEFRTDLSDDELVAAAFFTKNLGAAEKIQPLTLFGIYAENGDIILNRPENEKLLTTMFGSSFNANSFLVRSSSTKADDIGLVNNASPGALAVLKEAGLLKSDAEAPSSPVLDAKPRETPGVDAEVTETTTEPRRRREVVESADPTPSEVETPKPRRRRRERERRAEPREEVTNPVEESTPAREESPVPRTEEAPAPESNPEPSTGESPVPQPE